MAENLFDHRKSYERGILSEESVAKDPFQQFKSWFSEAKNTASIHEANAMTLSTLGTDNFPRGRVVLLKEYNDEGFVFYTNYKSEKGIALDNNPNACISFFWPPLERQIIIKGIAKKTSEEQSELYFKSRPKGSQLGALVSQQSRPVENREELEEKLAQLEEAYKNQEVPKPDHWGGYILKPLAFEFWQGRANRLHDRIEFYFESEKWKIRRLQP
ncbi:pyridoxamine 5'-phosphate oxidase [Constantimarinum furrinae]|uniref:Pyridoxine/pyridoxamine 5'-phosphate oxidase n=1 Tax=Constantimarinum furrinae TaxID=2562285 RepID=A0A7G8PWZ8_9FLAO|nr:pyridoxamine 5'-phosphate oxidase [Constantimarinum furrinae]QNJ98864.1 Pyridoxine/pyridoxamine 5'-phosphate oxidase [Constantimarinum furrinae]